MSIANVIVTFDPNCRLNHDFANENEIVFGAKQSISAQINQGLMEGEVELSYETHMHADDCGVTKGKQWSQNARWHIVDLPMKPSEVHFNNLHVKIKNFPAMENSCPQECTA